MLDIFQYAFMQKAFLVGILLAVIIPLIGVIVVLKRLSMIGDALSHTSLAGVALGLILGINPIVGAVVVCMAAAFSIEGIRKALPRYAEISISIIMSVGIGLASTRPYRRVCGDSLRHRHLRRGRKGGIRAVHRQWHQCGRQGRS